MMQHPPRGRSEAPPPITHAVRTGTAKPPHTSPYTDHPTVEAHHRPFASATEGATMCKFAAN